MRWGADRSVVRAAQTPEGVGTLHLVCRAAGAEVHAHAWGPGAGWLLDAVPALLGDDDDPSGFGPVHAPVADAWRRFPSWRVPRSGLLFDALAPAVIEQKVTGQEAFSGYRTLVRRFGTPAPGPVAGLLAPPTAAGWAAIPSWAWLQASVDGARSRTVVRAAGFAGRLEEAVGLGTPRRTAGCAPCRGSGCGPPRRWPSARWATPMPCRSATTTSPRTSGGHSPAAPVDDAGLAELLEPYAGHRYRVQHLLGLAGRHRPRRGPRMAPRTHLPTRR